MLPNDWQGEAPTVCVVGCGVVGVSTALALAERGYNLVMVDAATEIASLTSAGNGGQLSYCYTDALASPKLIKNMPAMLLGLDSAFRFRVRPKLSSLSWVLSFLRNCSRDRFVSNTLSVLGLSMCSRGVLEGWQRKYDIDFNYRKAGKLHLFQDGEQLKAQRAVIKMKSWLGTNQRIVTRDEALKIEPALGTMSGKLEGAVFSPDDAVGDAQEFAVNTSKLLERKFNADVRLDTKVTGLNVSRGRIEAVETNKGRIGADAFVFCTGASTSLLSEVWGESLPLMPMAGYSLTYPRNDHSPQVSITDVASKTVMCMLGDQLRFAGLADLGDSRAFPDKRRVEVLCRILERRYGRMADGSIGAKTWIGHRPMTPSSTPLIRKAKVGAAFLNCGHGMLGWTLASGSGHVVSGLVDKYFEKRNRISSRALALDQAI